MARRSVFGQLTPWALALLGVGASVWQWSYATQGDRPSGAAVSQDVGRVAPLPPDQLAELPPGPALTPPEVRLARWVLVGGCLLSLTAALSLHLALVQGRRAEELEDRLAARTAECAALQLRAEKVECQKPAFLATMSHEFRTPLNTILGFTNVLLRQLPGPVNEEQRKQLEWIREGGSQLLALINDVLELSRIETGRLEIVQREFRLVDAFANVLTRVAPMAAKKSIRLDSRLPPGPIRMTSDRRCFEQILVHLISSAIGLTEQGEVRVEAQVENGNLLTRVSDTSAGFQPEELAHVFDEFHSADVRAGRSGGTGLDLTLCKRLSTALGGGIRVESERGVGTTFTVKLPLSGRGEDVA